ncbi:SDR family NAD(P)-dependent oxidoreductase [Methylobacterium fujisawaense]|jgi:short-subunit dehydrogenase|uniref:SDR family NAD(P)-dependent oxidoreductase n=1 Tax=Methylobacterium fujisawaense TaxID=107400 RepID=UPI00313E88E7
MLRDMRHVLITGAGSGIGRALALEASARCMRVAICGRRKDALQETAELTGAAKAILILPADLTVSAERQALAGKLVRAWGRLDILMNNAGCVIGGDLAATSDAMLDTILDTNVVAPIALTRDLAPLLLASDQARVVNVGSMFGDIAYPGFASYSASKHALRGFSDALRREWKNRGIGVTYAAPRATRTPAAAAFGDLIRDTGMRLDDPEQVARRIWDATLSGADTVYPRGAESAFVLLQRLFPRVIDRALARQRPSAAVSAPKPISAT